MFGNKNNKNEILINKKQKLILDSFGLLSSLFLKYFVKIVRNFSLALTGNSKLEPVFTELNLAMHDL